MGPIVTTVVAIRVVSVGTLSTGDVDPAAS